MVSEKEKVRQAAMARRDSLNEIKFKSKQLRDSINAVNKVKKAEDKKAKSKEREKIKELKRKESIQIFLGA